MFSAERPSQNSVNGLVPKWPAPLAVLRQAPGIPAPDDRTLQDGRNSNTKGALEEPQVFDGSGSLKIVVMSPSNTSSCAKDYATTYRGLMRELGALGHEVLFLERDVPWRAANRDLPKAPGGEVALYSSLRQLKQEFSRAIRMADLVILGSYVQEGKSIGEWVTDLAQGVTAFFDSDTAGTIRQLAHHESDYLTKELVSHYQLYFSFTGGPLLEVIRRRYGAQQVLPLYYSVDPEQYYPEVREPRWDLGYLGPYSEDRQPALDELLLEPARNWRKGRFVVVGTHYPSEVRWPVNVCRHPHMALSKQRAFYNAQNFALNITGADSASAGYSSMVGLFQAAACGTPIMSDDWDGVDCFFEPGQEILIAHSFEESLYYLLETTEAERQCLGQRALARVLAKHTVKHRAQELVLAVREVLAPVGSSKFA